MNDNWLRCKRCGVQNVPLYRTLKKSDTDPGIRYCADCFIETESLDERTANLVRDANRIFNTGEL